MTNLVQIANRHVNPDTVESVEPWGVRLYSNGSTSSKGAIIHFRSGRKWKCRAPLTQVLSVLSG